MGKRLTALLLAVSLLLSLCTGALAADEVIEPEYPVPDYVTRLLEVASEEVGYTEGSHGWSKYGAWAGEPYAQWCAEFLCWCVDQVDQRYGTSLLRQVYPMYSGSNSGRSWFIRQGRYIVRNGYLEDWGYQWLDGADSFITTGSYIPQPGDWIFFTWDSDTDTDHVAMVEYCTRAKDGSVTVHVIEGNNPSKVARNTYALTYQRILGFGTVHDCAGWTMRQGNGGEKVRQLQEKLVRVGLLTADQVDGEYGPDTAAAVSAWQQTAGLKVTGIANMETQQALDRKVEALIYEDPDTWTVTEDDDDE